MPNNKTEYLDYFRLRLMKYHIHPDVILQCIYSLANRDIDIDPIAQADKEYLKIKEVENVNLN